MFGLLPVFMVNGKWQLVTFKLLPGNRAISHKVSCSCYKTIFSGKSIQFNGTRVVEYSQRLRFLFSDEEQITI